MEVTMSGAPPVPVRLYSIATTTGVHQYRMSDGSIASFTEADAVRLNPALGAPQYAMGTPVLCPHCNKMHTVEFVTVGAL